MIKTYCDMCGTLIESNINGVNLDFKQYGCVQFRTNWAAEKQLCLDCATKVLVFIDSVRIALNPMIIAVTPK